MVADINLTPSFAGSVLGTTYKTRVSSTGEGSFPPNSIGSSIDFVLISPKCFDTPVEINVDFLHKLLLLDETQKTFHWR